MWTVITNCLGLVGLMVSWFLVQRIGHRRLLLVGCVICTVSMVIIAILYTVPGLSANKAGIGLVVACSIYLFGFNFGLESYTFLTSGELPAQNLRGYTQGLSVGVSFIFAWLCTFTAPYFINPAELNWGPRYAWIWFASGILATAFIYFMLPDVKGRSLEEIDEMFRNRVPRREFQTYVCMEVEQARSDAALHAVVSDKSRARENEATGNHVENA
jgi:MFS family permease